MDDRSLLLGYILFFTFLGSVGSLIGGVVLILNHKYALRISHYLSAFAAGTLLGTAFLDLLPEAIHESGTEEIVVWSLIGFLIFFLLQRFIHWSHHHQTEEKSETKKPPKSVVALILLGDTVHNFIDGVVIAATFFISVPLGIVTSLAVAAHEIPQEIGDFGIMLQSGIKKGKVLLFNVLSGVTAMAGALLTFGYGESIEVFNPYLLALAAGFFIYIAASDLIPEIHNEEKKITAFIETVVLLFGVVAIAVLLQLLEGAH